MTKKAVFFKPTFDVYLAEFFKNIQNIYRKNDDLLFDYFIHSFNHAMLEKVESEYRNYIAYMMRELQDQGFEMYISKVESPISNQFLGCNVDCEITSIWQWISEQWN